MPKKTNYLAIKSSTGSADLEFITRSLVTTGGTAVSQESLPCINYIAEVLEIHYVNNNVKVDKLAKELGMVERTLRRKCKSLFGLNPNQLLNHYRIYKAKTMLAGSLSITEIAHAVGFSSNSYFTQVFKEVVGLLPQDFRKQ